MAWLIPVTLFVHQLEEYVGQFPLWFSDLLNADLSNLDFLVINSIGLVIISLLSLSYLLHKNNILLAALGTLIFVNGMVHLVLSVFTFSYLPGVISSIALFLPLGAIIYKRILPLLREGERIIAIFIGIIALFTVSMIAIKM